MKKALLLLLLIASVVAGLTASAVVPPLSSAPHLRWNSAWRIWRPASITSHAGLTPTTTGRTIGALLTGILARRAADASLANNLNFFVTDTPLQPLVFEQLAIGLTLVLPVAGTTVIAYIVKALVGLRPTVEVETIALDLAEHEEEGYHA
jgi:ammonia channel protein AmtB